MLPVSPAPTVLPNLNVSPPAPPVRLPTLVKFSPATSPELAAVMLKIDPAALAVSVVLASLPLKSLMPLKVPLRPVTVLAVALTVTGLA